RFTSQPRLSLLDGYVTIGDADHLWHLHLCIGATAGTPARPTPPELARWRRCARAAFFRDRDRQGRQSAWGLRLWNGRDEQMVTVFFPNPWLDADTMRPVRTPDWARVATWMTLRARHAGVPAEAPPTEAMPPAIH